MERAPEKAGGEAEGAQQGCAEDQEGAAREVRGFAMIWVEKLMWLICRMLADVMQLAGLIGLLGVAVIGLAALAERMNGG